MATGDWLNLLNWWSDEMQKLDGKFVWFYGDVFQKPALKLVELPERATDIQKLETRLGKPLPPSYRDFLTVDGTQFNRHRFYFNSFEKVDWFEKAQPSFFESWDFHCDDNNWLEVFPADYDSMEYGQLSYFTADQKELLQNMLYIGHDILLNPAKVNSEGEWEAWRLTENKPFITRYLSFYDLMRASYEDYRNISQVLWLEPEEAFDPATNKTTLQYPWQPFLQKWSELLFKPGLRENLFFDADDLEDDGFDLNNLQLIRPPASEREIKTAEKRLKTTLPPSYRQFLKVSNGLPLQHQQLLLELLPLAEVKWSVDDGMGRDYWEPQLEFAIPRRTGVSNEEYYDYARQDEVTVRLEHAAATLLIGNYDDNDFYFLNPLAVNQDGEWEAWTFYKEDGAQRYISFWHMFQEIYYRMFIM